MSYAFTTRLSVPFGPEAVARVRDALAAQGFGVLTEIDVTATMRKKLDVQMEDYLILGACNPPLALQALEADRDIGLLLPCNVVVRADGADATLVQAIDPQVMVQIAGEDEAKRAGIAVVAAEATRRLQAAIQSLAS